MALMSAYFNGYTGGSMFACYSIHIAVSIPAYYNGYIRASKTAYYNGYIGFTYLPIMMAI
jgi:hypothetical protein